MQRQSPGSLRAAYSAALDHDLIDLGKLQCSRITLASELSDPATANYVAVYSNGANVVIDAGKGRAFVHNGSGALELGGVTVTNGSYSALGKPSRGGCIFSKGSVYMVAGTVSSCSARSLHASAALGGAIYQRTKCSWR